jgi:hypothetical protein
LARADRLFRGGPNDDERATSVLYRMVLESSQVVFGTVYQ